MSIFVCLRMCMHMCVLGAFSVKFKQRLVLEYYGVFHVALVFICQKPQRRLQHANPMSDPCDLPAS